MKAYTFIILLLLVSLSFGHAARSLASLKTKHDVTSFSNEDTFHEGPLEDKNKVSEEVVGLHEDFPPAKLQRMSKEERASGSTIRPLGHSPGIGHGNSPDGRS